MRSITKAACPQILSDNKQSWDASFAAYPKNATAKYRYRHIDIKSALLAETSNKCVYCESKVGHNTPGDVEHKWPTAVHAHLHFEWENLTIACTECNRRKSALDPNHIPFLDPYVPNIEGKLVHHGPVVGWLQGDEAAETTVKTLELDSVNRLELILRKIEKINDISILKGRIVAAQNPALKSAHEQDLQRRALPTEEFSGMVSSLL